MSETSSNNRPLVTATRSVAPGSIVSAGGLDAVACSALALELLQEAAGADHKLASFTLNLGSLPQSFDGALSAEGLVDRRTRTLTFCQVRVMADEGLVFAARGLFSRTI